MLNELKQSYERYADTVVPGWEDIDKNTLINLCVDNKENNSLYQGYLSAILCKYWGYIPYFYKKNSGAATVENCYEWLLYAVLYAVNNHPWRDETKSIYNDPNGPDKVVNRCIYSIRTTWYQKQFADKRQTMYRAYSLEDVYDKFGDGTNIVDSHKKQDGGIGEVHDITDYVIMDAIKKRDWFQALVVDNIGHFDSYDVINEGEAMYTKFNSRKLIRLLRHCDESYFNYFKNRYGVETNELKECVEKIKKFPSGRINRWVRWSINKLKKDRNIKEVIGDVT